MVHALGYPARHRPKKVYRIGGWTPSSMGSHLTDSAERPLPARYLGGYLAWTAAHRRIWSDSTGHTTKALDRVAAGQGPSGAAQWWCPRQDSNLRHRLRRPAAPESRATFALLEGLLSVPWRRAGTALDPISFHEPFHDRAFWFVRGHTTPRRMRRHPRPRPGRPLAQRRAPCVPRTCETPETDR
jgi:hypothetical protein